MSQVAESLASYTTSVKTVSGRDRTRKFTGVASNLESATDLNEPGDKLRV